MTLEAISDKTKISRSVLQALEGGDFAKLPDRVFVRMFLRQMLKILGEDEREWLQGFEGSWARFVRASQPLVVVAAPPPVRRPRLGPWLLGGAVVAASVVLLVFLGGRFTGHDEGAAPPAPAAQPGRTVAGAGPAPATTGPPEPPPSGPGPGPAAEQPAAAMPLPAATPAVSERERTLVIATAGGACWVSVTVDGRPPIEKLLPPGFRWEVETGGAAVDLVLGDGGVVRVDYDGLHQGPVGARGQVVRLHLDPAKAADGARP